MADRIRAAFEAARDEGRAALMPYMMGSFPSQEGAMAIAEAYAEGGADLIELGVPFSDPLADGPVIHAAATEALRNGATLHSALEICTSVAGRLPVVLMVYSNMILARGPAEFAAEAAQAGAAGAIVPDLTLEEGAQIRAALAAEGLALVPLVAPTTPADRQKLIAASADGFLYAVSDVGVTGERDRLPERLTGFVTHLRSIADVPVAVGFGIGTPDQAASVGAIADGVIIGTRLVRIAADGDDGPRLAREFLDACRNSMRGVSPSTALGLR
jgi:tryptophan synthase alpha chain